MAPVNDYHTGHPRLTQLTHSSTSNSLSSLQNSPSTSRSTRNLGAIGGRSGPGYSPYARRVSRAAAAAREEEEFEDDATIRGEGESEVGDSPVQQRSGLFGRVKSLPGKALGWLTRSSSSKTLSSSTSLADVRAAVEEEQAKEQGNGIGRGMQRSKTANNLARAADSPSAPSALPSRLRSRQPQQNSLPSSSSMSALSSIGSPFAPSGLRSSHSTLNLASASTNGSGVPSFLTTSNLSRHSRAVSPALSSASYAHSRRSPSPMRNGLAGSMSAVNLAQPRSPTSAFGGAHDTTTLGNAAMTSGSNPFGLTSRSPFAPGGGGGRSGSQRAVSVAGSHRSSSTRPEGHALFPYTSTIPRGASPSIAGSQSMREGLSSFASAPSPHPTSAPSTAQKRPYARVGSPLNPRSPFSPTEGEGSQTGGAERARKKQMVWDPARGLVSRERLDMEKERDAPPLPKNEAERILEVLEGMGRTPLGEAKRGAARAKKISVPAPVSPGDNSRLARSSNGPSAAPYAARQAPSNSAASSGKGLQSVLRAREERRRALVEQEREERERERKEKEERDRRRDERRRELERLEREADEEDELESVMSQDYDDEEDRPRRRTRSSAAAPKSKKLEPPTPRRSTRASARNAKSPSPLPTPKKKGKSKRVQQDDEEEMKDAELEPPSTRQKRTISKSPAPPSEASERMHSGSPPPPPKIVFPPPAVPSTSANPTQRSSLRPGKSHSSRQHTASSKVFSAREEDLPPIDDDALSKIQMPAMKFPSSFSFGAPAPSKPAESGTTSPPADSDKKEEGSSLLSRLSAAPVPSSDKPAFSFGTSAPSTSTIPPLPAISFGAASSKPAPASSLFKPTPPAADLFAPKPSAPSTSPSSGFSFATPSTSTPAVPKATLPAPSDGAKPNFFGSIIAEKKEETPKAAPLPSFTFGSTSSTPAINSTEGPSETEKEKKDVPASNPFAAFGKPVSEIIKESNEGKTGGEESLPVEKKDEVAKPMFSFGAAATAKPAEKTESAPAASPFAFKPTPSTSASSAPSFSFGASKPVDETTKPASTSSFSFGSTPSVPPTTSTPKATFTFGTTPATPTAEEKASTPIPSAPPSPFGALAPPGPASVAGTDDADGDSGMEDEAEPASSTSKPNTASPAPFSFGSAAPSSSTSTGLFGAPPSSSSTTTGFTFGSSAPSGDKKESAPSPFGAPSTTSTNSLFGGPSSTSAAKPFTFGSPSPSPAPQSPAAAAPSTTSFSFGQPSTSAAPASSPFTFGATAPSNPSPFGNPSSRPASPAPASTGFSFGAASSNPPASPSAPFAFGSQSASNNSASSAMGQTLSAPGTNGAASPFGAPSTSSFAFGNSASQPVSPSASTSTSSFNFGGAQAAPPSFSFGASTSGGAPPASPFGAPSNAAPAAGGFSFGAPTGSGATTPTGGGLFNLGSGGEDAAGKSGRPIRPLRRRK